MALLGYGCLLGALGCAHSPATTPAAAAPQPEPAGDDLALDSGAPETPPPYQTVTIQHPPGTSLRVGPAPKAAVGQQPQPTPVRRHVTGLLQGVQAPMPAVGQPKRPSGSSPTSPLP